MCDMTDGSKIKFSDLYGDMMGAAYTMNKYDSFLQDLEDVRDGATRSILQRKNLPEKHEMVVNLQNELDNKMRQLYNPETSDNFIMYDARN